MVSGKAEQLFATSTDETTPEDHAESLAFTQNSAVVKLTPNATSGMDVKVGASFDFEGADEDTLFYGSLTAMAFYGVSALLKYRPHLLIGLGADVLEGTFDPHDYDALPLSDTENELRDQALEDYGVTLDGNGDDGCTGDPENCPVCGDDEMEELEEMATDYDEDPRKMSLDQLAAIKPQGRA